MLVTMATLWTTGAPTDPAVLGAHTMAVALADGLHVVTMVAIAVWVHRAYTNLAALGAATSLVPATAAAYFVVPGANLLVPHTVLRELWRGSAPSNPAMLARPIGVVMLWWYAFVAGSVGTNVGVSWLIRDPDGASARAMLIIAPVLASIAALGGMDVIKLIDARQSVRRNVQRMRMERTPSPAPAAAPVASKTAGWTAALLPVATVIEKEMAQAEAEPPPARAVVAPPDAGRVALVLIAVAALAGILTLVAAGLYVKVTPALYQLEATRWLLYGLSAFAALQLYDQRDQMRFEVLSSRAALAAALCALLLAAALGPAAIESDRLPSLLKIPLYGLWATAALILLRALPRRRPAAAAASDIARGPDDVAVIDPVLAANTFGAMPLPENIPRNLAPAPQRGVLLLFGIVAMLAAVQALVCLGASAMPHADNVGFFVAVLPVALPLYAVSFGAAILFAVWLGRAYANLRAYVPELPRDDAARDFVRGGGNPAVLEELWYVSMTDVAGSSILLVTLWAKSWRALQIAAALFALSLAVIPHQAAALVGAAMFVLWSASALLALCVCHEIGNAQRQRLTLVWRAVAATGGTPLPPPLPT